MNGSAEWPCRWCWVSMDIGTIIDIFNAFIESAVHDVDHNPFPGGIGVEDTVSCGTIY